MSMTREAVTAEGEMLANIVRKRNSKLLAEVDYQRELVFVANAGISQRSIARAMNVSQPTISAALRTARRSVRPVPAGFSGASPYEIAQRYATGEITRNALIGQLVRWDYDTTPTTDGVDGLLVDDGRSWLEVEQACQNGLIDDDLYDEILDRLESKDSNA